MLSWQAMLSWQKSWRENRLKAGLIQVIDALTGSPGGMEHHIKVTIPDLPLRR